MSRMFQSSRPYKIHWEITDLCNLKCPMCPRTDRLDHCRPVKEIERTQFFLEDVKRFFPERFLERLARVDFCGNFGDPCIARDFHEICDFLLEGHRIPLTVSTNGAMRAPAWWGKLGRLFSGSKSRIEFHIDGLRDTLPRYRIGADWDRVMANAAAYIAGGGIADWHFIIFRHNQHQLEKAWDIARNTGFSHFVPTDTGRFPGDGLIRYQHPDGDWRALEQASLSARAWAHAKAHRIGEGQGAEEGEPGTSGSGKSLPLRVHDSDSSGRRSRRIRRGKISCKASSQNRFFLDSRGDVAPCCWASNRDLQRPGAMLSALSAAGRDPQDFNIHTRPIEEIVQDELFTKFFPVLWKSDELATCRKKCGRRHRNIRIKMKL